VTAQPNIAAAAALFGDPARAAMLIALLDRPVLSAGELALAANVSPVALIILGFRAVITDEGKQTLTTKGYATSFTVDQSP